MDTCRIDGNLTTPTRAPTSSVRFQGSCNYGKVGLFLSGHGLSNGMIAIGKVRMKLLSYLLVLAFCGEMLFSAELTEVCEDAIAEMGTTSGIPQMNGFVFLEGRYLPPPYTVSRKGNALFINRIQFEQPVAWSYFNAADGVPTAKKAVDADGDFQAVSEKAEKAVAKDVQPAQTASDKPKAVKSIDDLFDDDAKDKPAAKPAAPVAKKSAEETATAAVPKADEDASVAAPTQRSPEDVKRLKGEVKAKLDAMRKGYEQSLARGEFFFFGQRNSRVNGNYGTARALMKVLPNALRQSQSAQDLMQRLNEGDVYFLDLGNCAALFRNRNTFPQLEERRQKIEEDEKYEAQRRNRSSAW